MITRNPAFSPGMVGRDPAFSRRMVGAHPAFHGAWSAETGLLTGRGRRAQASPEGGYSAADR